MLTYSLSVQSGFEIHYRSPPPIPRYLRVEILDDGFEACWTFDNRQTGQPVHPPGVGWDQSMSSDGSTRWVRTRFSHPSWIGVRYKDENGRLCAESTFHGDWMTLDPTDALRHVAPPRQREDQP